MSSYEPGDHPFARVGREPGADTTTLRASVAIGFGSPSGDTGVTRLDLNDLLIRHSQASFVMRASGDAMREIGIDDGDLLLIDRAIDPVHGHVVVAVVGDEFVCRRLSRQGPLIRLQATRIDCADIEAREGMTFELWGVVTHAIKALPA